MRATKRGAVALAAAVGLVFAACSDDGSGPSGQGDGVLDSANRSSVEVTVVGIRGYRGGDLAGVVHEASDGTVVGGFSASVGSDDFTTTKVVRNPGGADDAWGATWPSLTEEAALLTPGEYVVMLWLDTGLGGYTPWLPLNTDGRGLAGCVHRFEVTDDDTTEVVVSGDVSATGYVGVCGTAAVGNGDEETSADDAAADVAALSCLPMDPDGWARSDDLVGAVDTMRLATDGVTVVALGVGADGRLAVHHSTDGLVWEPGEGMPPMTLEGPIVDVAGGPNGFVAVGVTGPISPTTPVVAVSSDGADWERIDPDSLPRSSVSWFSGVVSGRDGFVVVGTARDRERFPTFVWHSDDGRTWVEPDVELGDGPVAITSTTDGWLLLGGPEWPNDGSQSRVWASENGAEWTEIETETAPPTASLLRYVGTAPLLAPLLDDDDAVVLVPPGPAHDDLAPLSVWVSTDEGATWNERTVSDDPEPAAFWVDDVAATPSGLLIAGHRDEPGGPSTGFVYSSRDLVSWQPCWTDGLELGALDVLGDGLVAVTGDGTVHVWNEP